MLGAFTRPAMLAVLTMSPRQTGSARAAASISGVKTRTPWATPIRLTPMTHSQSFSVCSQINPPAPTPALLKTKWGVPKRCSVAAARASTSTALDTSSLKGSTGAPRASISRCAAASASACTSAITILMPSRAAMRLHSRPKPEAAPVMTAMPPCKWLMGSPVGSGRRRASSCGCPRH
jgi:hypothetical protein